MQVKRYDFKYGRIFSFSDIDKFTKASLPFKLFAPSVERFCICLQMEIANIYYS